MNLTGNSLEKEIRTILDIYEKYKDQLGYFEFAEPATEQEISDWEKTSGITLPESYKDWLRFSNGSTIDRSLAEFFGLEEIIPEALNDFFTDEYVWIGNMIGIGEELFFSRATGKIVWHDHGEFTEYDSIKEILLSVIDMLEDTCSEF